MINQKKVLAIIPARGGSKGLPGKNIRPLAGRPLIGWPINAAKASRYIDRIVVSTDDPAIAEIALAEGAEVPFIRPQEFAKDQSPSSDAIIHALNFCTKQEGDYDYLVLLEPTSPLTEAFDIDAALERLVEQDRKSIVGVCKTGNCHPLYCATMQENHVLKPFNRESFSKPVRRQDVNDLYFFEGSLYISDVKHYLETATFYHESTLAYVVPAWKALEVDSLLDFLMIETVMQNKALLELEKT